MTDSAAVAELAREAERVADRLRVLAPRWGQRDSDRDAAAVAAVRAALQSLADLSADAGGEPRRPVPELALRSLADQVLVLVHEAARARACAAATDVLIELRHSL